MRVEALDPLNIRARGSVHPAVDRITLFDLLSDDPKVAREIDRVMTEGDWREVERLTYREAAARELCPVSVSVPARIVLFAFSGRWLPRTI